MIPTILLDAAQVVARATEPAGTWLSSPAGIAIITSAASLLSLWIGSRLRLGEATQAGRIAAEEAATRRAEEAAAARREQERNELVEARKEEVRLTRELRDELRDELKELRERVQLLEGELEEARLERVKHGEERLEWFGERDRMQRELAAAREMISATRAELELAHEELHHAREEVELARTERERSETQRAELAERLECMEKLLHDLENRTQHAAFRKWLEEQEPKEGEGAA